MTRGLVGYWPFNGNAIDESVFSHNGTVFGATLTKDRFGNSNSAYSLDGVNDYIHIGSTSDLKPKDMTVNIWFKIQDTTRQAALFGCYNAGYGEWGIDFHQRPGFGLCSGIGAGANNRYQGHRIKDWCQDGNWHMATLVYNSTNNDELRMYVDTIDLGKGSVVGSSGGFNSSDLMTFYNVDSWYFGAASQYFSIPNENNGPFYFKGELDDASIFDRALTFSEIKTLFLDSSSNPSSSQIFTDQVPDYHIYPNPSATFVKVSSPDIAKVEVYAKDGKLIKVFTSVEIAQNRIDISSLHTGIYSFLLYSREGQLLGNERFLKQ